MIAAPLHYERDGAEHIAGAAAPLVVHLEQILDALPGNRAGHRLHNLPQLGRLLGRDGLVGAIAAARVGKGARPVRAILFDKTATTNWALGWHQDRTIAVAKRVNVPGFGPWTIKHGIQHVAPPFEILADMVTIRVHLDPVPATNAPLLIAPGSHLCGRVAEPDIADIVARCGTVACEAEAGDLWLYATPILHASQAATRPGRRRVLQVDYAGKDLPGSIEWLPI